MRGKGLVPIITCRDVCTHWVDLYTHLTNAHALIKKQQLKSCREAETSQRKIINWSSVSDKPRLTALMAARTMKVGVPHT